MQSFLRILFLPVVCFLEPLQAATPFSIENAIESTLQVSPKLRQVDADRKIQREKKRQAWALLGPQVKTSYTEVRFENKIQATLNGQNFLVRDDKSKIGNVRVVQPIISLLPLYEYARVQGLSEKLAGTRTQIVSAEIAFHAAEMWLRAYQADKQLQIAQASILATESQLKDARALERAGRLNRADVLKLELLHSESSAKLAQAEAVREIAYTTLKESSGLDPKLELHLEERLPTPLIKDKELNDVLKEAMDRRLERKYAQGQQTVAWFGYKLSLARFSPDVGVFYQVERNFGSLTALGQTERNTPTYGVQLTWDIWDNGSRFFAVREVSQQGIQADEAVRDAEMNLRIDIMSAFASLKASKESLALAKLAVKQASEAYRITRSKFLSGTSSATDLVLAESSSTGAKDRLVTVESDYILWQLKMQKAMGEERPVFVK